MKTKEALRLLKSSLTDLCIAFNEAKFTPILEADIASFLYHRLIVNGCPPESLYMNTRVCGLKKHYRKYDLAIGTLNKEDACLTPVLIAQLKAFQRWGLKDQQHRRRFQEVINNDIPSLDEASKTLVNGRVHIVSDLHLSADNTGFLEGWWQESSSTKIELLTNLCKDLGIWLFWIRPDTDGKVRLDSYL